MTRDEFAEQMHPCRACGRMCDGDVCDSSCASALDAEDDAVPCLTFSRGYCFDPPSRFCRNCGLTRDQHC